jgi:hypothetical protein
MHQVQHALDSGYNLLTSHPYLLGCIHLLGYVYMQLERYSDAAAPFQYHLKRQTILKGPSHPLTQVAMRLPTKQRLYARNLEKAEKLFRELVQMVNVSRDVHKGFREECMRELCGGGGVA